MTTQEFHAIQRGDKVVRINHNPEYVTETVRDEASDTRIIVLANETVLHEDKAWVIRHATERERNFAETVPMSAHKPWIYNNEYD